MIFEELRAVRLELLVFLVSSRVDYYRLLGLGANIQLWY